MSQYPPFIQSLFDQIRTRIGRTVYRIKMIAEWAEIEESEVWARELDSDDIDFIFENFIK